MKILHIHIHIRIFSRARIYPRILSMKKSWIHIQIHENPWIHGYIRGYYIYKYYLQRESLSKRSFLIVPLLKFHRRNPRRSRPVLNNLSTSTSAAGTAK